MLHTGMATPFQNVHESDDVAINIGIRILQGIAHPRLSRKVNDPIKLLLIKKCHHGLAINHVHLYKAESGVGSESLQPGLFQIDIVVIVQIIQPDHLITACQQTQCRGHANEACCACQ